MDLVMLAMMVAFFGLSYGLVKVCEKLQGEA